MSKIEIRPAQDDDLPAVRMLVQQTNVLDLHTPYTYWTVRNTGTMLLAVDGAELAGFVMGIWTGPAHPSGFLWQIGVGESWRGCGVGLQLLNGYVQALSDVNCREFSTTIDAANSASLALFRRFARDRELQLRHVGETGTAGGLMKIETVYQIALN